MASRENECQQKYGGGRDRLETKTHWKEDEVELAELEEEESDLVEILLMVED